MGIPKKVLDWINDNVTPGTSVYNQTIEFLERIVKGERLNWNDVYHKTIRYVVSKMRKDNVLMVVRDSRGSYFVINPSLIE